MKQHPTKGEHILDAVPLLKEKTGDGLLHHENVDGTGYPERPQGRRDPADGRIVGVADAFDAMTTDRPYSKARTYEPAIARLRELADKKFDEPGVDAFERAFATGDLSADQGPARVDRLAPLRHQGAASASPRLRRLCPRPRRAAPAPPGRRAYRHRVNEHEPRPGSPCAVPLARPPGASRRRARPAAAQSPADAEQRFSTGIMHLREGRVGPRPRRAQEGGQGGPEEPVLPEGPRPRVRGEAAVEGRDRLLPQGARAQPVLRGRAQRPRRGPGRLGRPREGGRRSSSPRTPTRRTRPPRSPPATSARPTSRRRTTRRRPSWFKTSIGRNKGYVAAYVGLGRDPPRDGPDRRGDRPARAGRGRSCRATPTSCWRSAQACVKGGPLRGGAHALEDVVKKDPAGPAGRAAAEQLKALPR